MKNDKDYFDFWGFWDEPEKVNEEDSIDVFSHDKEKVLYRKHRRNRVKMVIRMSHYQKMCYTNGHYSLSPKSRWETGRFKSRENRRMRHEAIYFYGERKESEKLSTRGNVLMGLN